MNRKFLFVLIAGLIGALGLVGLGCEMCCNSSQGSGSITIADPTPGAGIHKATFSYRVECVGSYADPVEDPKAVRTVKGRLEYKDHRPWKNGDGKVLNVSIHGVVNDVLDTDVVVQAPGYTGDTSRNDYCSVQKPNVAMFKGRYRPQPGGSPDDVGEFNVIVEDKGKAGPSSEDTFEIELTSGVFKGYKQSGVLAGGNIRAL